MPLTNLLRMRFASLSVVASCAIGCSAADEAIGAVDMPVVGGLEAPLDAWPGTVSIHIRGRHGCGGTLVASRWVVTAGHCVDAYYADGAIDKVVIGRHALSSTAGEERRVARAYRHEAFSWMSLEHDIALLELAEPSTMPTAMLVTPELDLQVVDGVAATVVGWGSTSEGSEISDVERQATLPILPHAQCASYPHYTQILGDVLCAGFVNGGFDACQGDSGGPLFVRMGGVPVHVGVVSWGIGCARPNRPGVYTRVGSYLDWMFQISGGAIGAASAAPSRTVTPAR